MTKAIYKFGRYYGRMGGIDGVFVADTERVEKSIGKTAYLGDVLGKHSDISVIIDEDTLEFVTDDAKVIDMFEQFKLSSGYNLLEYIEDEETDEETDNF